MSKLNVKQELFVKHYLMSFNAKQAAIKAGYSERTAEQQGARLLSNVKVDKIIQEEMARLRERMSEDANKIYAGLWQELNELTDKINSHYQAEKAVKKHKKERNVILLEVGADNEYQLEELRLKPKELFDLRGQLRIINFMEQEAAADLLRPAQFFKAQELRAKLLHDLFDRAGYKPTDKINLEANVSGGLDLSYMTDEELEKEAAKLL
jgi:phage terminase small subunit